MEEEKYVCWGDDKEDLTEKVVAAKLPDGEPMGEVVIEVAIAGEGGRKKRRRQKQRRWRVVVECSKGHKNIFEGED